MSRIDDDRQADLAAQRAAAQRRAEEQRKVERGKTDSNFSQLIQAQKGQRVQAQEQKSAVQALLEEAQATSAKEEGDAAAQARGAETRGRARMTTGKFDEKVHQDGDAKGDRAVGEKSAEEGAALMGAADRGHDGLVSQVKAGARGQDHRDTEDGQGQRGKDLKGTPGGRAVGQKGDLKADDSGSGGKKGSGGDSKGQKGQSEAPAGFRFNPALMAPVPVAKAKDPAGSSRLRAIANEIAQRIVERVRVGENAAGKAEFQIDLRSDVLKGLSIKVSGSNGRISAVFSGSDREILKMLQEQGETLKSALSGRGLELTEFKVEERE